MMRNFIGTWKIEQHRRSALFSAALVGVFGCVAPDGPDGELPTSYRVEMNGRPADTELVAAVTWPPGEYAGFVDDSAFCGRTGYLMTREVVHRIDLDTGTVRGRIGRRGQGPGEWSRAIGLAADCDGGVLYVVDTVQGILAYSLPAGEYLGVTSRPTGFQPGHGQTSVTRGVLAVPGLWPPNGGHIDTVWLGRGMYEGTRIGWAVSTASDEGRPVAEPLEDDCHATPSACFTNLVDGFQQSGSPFWLVGQGGSTSARVVDADGAPVTAVDIRSPLFARDGTRVELGSLEAEARWGVTNSEVQGVYAWNDTLAVVHTLHATTDWRPGQIMQFSVFLNLFSSTGEPLVVDVGLPDLSIGRSGEHIYFLDYGEAGRARNVDAVDVLRLSLPGLRDRLLAP